MTAFFDLGFTSSVVACSATPEADGYEGQRYGLPYHVHPEATPDEWAAIIEAINLGEVSVAAWVAPVVPIETALANLRLDRDLRLARTDWTQMPDAPLSQERRAAFAAYRQALRDLPEAADPVNPVWPEIPA